jgi:hypothetical protein
MTYKEPVNYNAHFDIGISPFITAGDSDAVQNITVDSDMPNQGPDVQLDNGVQLKARSTVSGNVYFDFTSDADSTGFELAAGESVFVQVQNLNVIWFYADTAGNQICALKA